MGLLLSTPTSASLIPQTIIITAAILSSEATLFITVSPVAASCDLYPIALPIGLLANGQPGDVFEDILNGTESGEFAWLTWGGNNSVSALVASLTPPGNSHIYVNPNDASDQVVSIGDWIEAKPGTPNANTIRNALDNLQGMDIIVPVWQAVQGNGASATYQISGFVQISLLDYQLPGRDKISLTFQGTVSCAE